MAYQIEYSANGNRKLILKSWRYLRTIVKAAAICVLAGILIWSAGGDWQVTAAAFEILASELGEGDGIADAFSDFCIAILQGV